MQIHKFYLLLLFLSLLLPAVSMAQTPDTLYVFRFVSHKNIFYIPWGTVRNWIICYLL